MSPDAYLAFERQTELRHEYVDGFVYAMTGVKRRHAKVVGNLLALIAPAAQRAGCEAFVTDLKVRVGDTRYYYPDLLVTCGPADDDADVVTDPCLVVEVLSPSTASVDRREKLAAYRTVPSLQAYLVVDPTRPHVERHWRDAAGDWNYEAITPASGGQVSIPCPATTLTLDAILAGVQLRSSTLRRVKEPAPTG